MIRSKAFKAAFAVLACSLAAGLQPAAAAQVPLGPEFLVNTTTVGNQTLPAVAAAADGRFVVVWDGETSNGNLNDVYGQLFSANGDKVGPEFVVNSFTTGRQSNPAVAMDAQGNFVVVWNSATYTEAGTGVYARRFLADGTPAADQFQVNLNGRGLYPLAGVAMDAAGNYAITWTERAATGLPVATNIALGYVMVQRYFADGSLNGEEITAAKASLTNLRVPSIGLDAKGGFVVAWNSDMQPGFFTKQSSLGIGLGIYVRRFGADGEPLGPKVQCDSDLINALVSTPVLVDRPALAVAGDGSFTVLWQTNDDTLAATGVAGKRFDVNGAAVGPIFYVDRGNLQRRPAVAANASGETVVLGHGAGLFARGFNRNGVARSAPFRVDGGAATGRILQPAVAIDGSGRFIAVWQTLGQDGSGRGIYARRYGAP